MLTQVLCVGAGGFFGSIARYLVGLGLQRWLKPESFPIGTLTVNVVGCLLIGVLVGLKNWSQSSDLSAFLMAGFLGGLTTFSSFGNDTFRLFSEGRTGLAAANVGLNLVLGLVAVWAGFSVGKTFT